MKPAWDNIWMRLAISISEKSNDPKHQVAAVVVTEDNTTVCSLGYNGDEVGGENKRDSLDQGKSGFIHAEANCLLHLNFADQRNKKMYLTLSPCTVCARMIVNAKTIKEVIYNKKYDTDTKGLDILEKHGIITREYEVQTETTRFTF